MLRRGLDVLLRLAAVFLAAALCSYLTINQPVPRVLYDALANLGDFLLNVGRHWGTFGPRVLSAYGYSAVVLFLALGVGLLIGIPAGFLVGARPHSGAAMAIRTLSYLGTLTPSFLLALTIMVFFVLWVLPATGIRFIMLTSQVADFDPRRLLPITLTLMARPLAHFTAVTSAATFDALAQDYARTAYSKGLTNRGVLFRHIWPNVLPALLNTVPVALLFSASSLPIVEFVFNWPGVGRELLYQVVTAQRSTSTGAAHISFLLAGLGIAYVLVVLATEAVRERVDPLAERENG